jgi:hypothetical protein
MIPKSGCRFSEKIMLKQRAKAKYRINQNHFALAARCESVRLQRAPNHAAPELEIPNGGRLISNYGKGAGRCQQRTHQQRYGPQRRIVPGGQ